MSGSEVKGLALIAAFFAARLLASCATADAAEIAFDGLFPAGAQRGQTVSATATTKSLDPAAELRVVGDGVAATRSKEPGKFEIRVATDATPGVRLLRVTSPAGASELRPFVVGTLPELVEKEPNNELSDAERVSLPEAVVNGRLQKAGDVDTFALELAAGQTLVASVDANRLLGSPMDGVLQVVDSAGNVLAQNHDDRGLDPRVVFRAPRSEKIFVRLFAFPAIATGTIGFAGGAPFVYRLTLARGPFIDYAFPLAVEGRSTQTVELCGWNLAESQWRTPCGPGSAGSDSIVFLPNVAGLATVRLMGHPCMIESPAGKSLQKLVPPMTVSGRIGQPDEKDSFEIEVRKGQRLALGTAARALGFPTDLVLKVFDTRGKLLATADDVKKERDPSIDFAPPADGICRVELSELTGGGSSRHVYRLTVMPATPDFRPTLASSRIDLVSGKTVDVDVSIDRERGFDADIELAAVELPRGVRLEQPAGAKTKGAKTLKLRLVADKDAQSGPARLTARSGTLVRPIRVPVADTPSESEALWICVPPAGSPARGESP